MMINVIDRNQLLIKQNCLRAGETGDELVICVCFLFKLNYAFLGQARIQSLQRK